MAMQPQKGIDPIERRLDMAMQGLQRGQTLTLPEIAARAQLPETTVKSILRTGMNKMRKSAVLRSYAED